MFAGACSLEVTPTPASPLEGNVGLELNVINGEGSSLSLQTASAFYVKQLRFQVREMDFPVPGVIDWLRTSSELAEVDWGGTTTVASEIARERDGTYTETRGHLGAAWMEEDPRFELSFFDAEGARVAGPVDLRGEGFVLARQTAISWIEGEPSPGDYGANVGLYDALTVTSGGAFNGALDEIYDIVVVAGGALGAGATVSVRSLRLNEVNEHVITTGQPIALGDAGATITFSDAGDTVLVEGDHWIVRCTAGDDPTVLPVEAGVRAKFSAIAEIRLQFPWAEGATAFALPPNTHEARLTWSAKPDAPYVIPVTVKGPEGGAPGYGLHVELSLSEPANGSFYVGGETIELSVDLFDGEGQRLHEPGALPTYRQYLSGQSNGIMYYDLSNDPSLGFFTENRLNLMRLAIFGPTNLVEQNYTEDEPDHYVHEVNLPDIATIILRGFGTPPTTWDEPVPNSGEFVLPMDVAPGTYIALAKTARFYKGEILSRIEHVAIQVGREEPSEFVESVGNCQICHAAEASLALLRHGIEDASAKFCEACHVPPHNEPIAVIVHRVHFFSANYPARKSGCALCHLERESNTRASIAVCGACHGAIHPGEDLEFDSDPYARCGQTCHGILPDVHAIVGGN